MKALKILVVEDNALVAELLAELLVELGHEVCAVETTEDGAVASAARHKPDLMIIDVRLGLGSGIGAMDTITRTDPMPHVFVSGDITKIRQLHPNAVALQKPYAEATLVAAMERAMVANSDPATLESVLNQNL